MKITSLLFRHIFFAFALLASATMFADNPNINPPPPPPQPPPELSWSGNYFMLGTIRGTFVLTESPIELVRWTKMLAIDPFDKPETGIICSPFTVTAGCVWGSVVMTGRILVGTMDIISLGLCGKVLYTKQIPPFIWESSWKL